MNILYIMFVLVPHSQQVQSSPGFFKLAGITNRELKIKYDV